MDYKKREAVNTRLAAGILSLVFLMLVFLNIFAGEHWIDSDMAAEMIFSKLIAEEGGLFATTNWYYSTEFRILYTQLIMVPLFHIFESWRVIRIITNIVTYLLLLGSYFYFMKPLCSKRSTVIYSSVILLLPFSETFVTHVQMGNTYMPHMIIVFFCFGMFLRLVGVDADGECRSDCYAEKCPEGACEAKAKMSHRKRCGKRALLLICYILLSVICGMSGVRYVLALQAPMVLTSVWMMMKSAEFSVFRREVSPANLKKLLTADKLRYMWYALLGLFCAMVGYLINIAVIAKMYQFQTYEATNFIQVFQGVLLERFQNTLGNLLMLFGYIENKGFLSLRGVISLIAFALLAGIVLLTLRCSQLLRATAGRKNGQETEKTMRGKKTRNDAAGKAEQLEIVVPALDHKYFILRFFIAAFILNTFVFLFTTSTMTSRYYITVFIFVLPLLCMYFDMETLPLDRILVVLFLCGTLGLSSAKCVYSFLDKDKNAEEKRVAQFLQEEEYDFGYATYWNANILTELTNGYVEVANVLEVDEMSMFYWSSPKMYYEEDYHTGKTFLLLTTEEAAKHGETEAVSRGEIVYEDENYIVYHYDTVEELLQ